MSTTPEPPVLPVFVWQALCYGTCSKQRPPGYPAAAVYADGSIIASDLNYIGDAPGSVASVRLVVRAGQLTPAKYAELRTAVLALAAVGGANVKAGCEVSEGEDIVLARFDGTTSKLTTWAFFQPEPCPGGPPGAAEQAGRAADLARIVKADIAATPITSPARWAVLAAAPHPAGPPVVRTDWAGPDPAALTADGPVGERCAILNDQEIAAIGTRLTITPDGTFGVPVYEINGTPWRIWLRPLLPHEHTCQDINATAGALGTTADKLEGN